MLKKLGQIALEFDLVHNALHLYAQTRYFVQADLMDFISRE